MTEQIRKYPIHNVNPLFSIESKLMHSDDIYKNRNCFMFSSSIIENSTGKKIKVSYVEMIFDTDTKKLTRIEHSYSPIAQRNTDVETSLKFLEAINDINDTNNETIGQSLDDMLIEIKSEKEFLQNS